MRTITKVFIAVIACTIAVACGNGTGQNAGSSADSSGHVGRKDSMSGQTVAGAHAFPEFSFISDGRFIVLCPADTGWCKGLPKYMKEHGAGVQQALSDANPDALPQKYKALLHTKMRVCSDKGETGIAEITSLKLLSEFIPHFGQVQAWKGSGDDGPAYTDAQIAMDIRRSAPMVLVAEFDFTDKKKMAGNCRFAMAESNTAPRVYAGAPDKALEDMVRAAAFKTDSYKNIQKEYALTTGAKTSWTKDEQAETQFFHFKNTAGTDFVTLTQYGGNPCGGDFYAEVFSLWKINNGTPEMLWIMKANLKTIMALDLDNDDFPELLVQAGTTYKLYKLKGGKWECLYEYELVNRDCPV